MSGPEVRRRLTALTAYRTRLKGEIERVEAMWAIHSAQWDVTHTNADFVSCVQSEAQAAKLNKALDLTEAAIKEYQLVLVRETSVTHIRRPHVTHSH